MPTLHSGLTTITASLKQDYIYLLIGLSPPPRTKLKDGGMLYSFYTPVSSIIPLSSTDPLIHSFNLQIFIVDVRYQTLKESGVHRTDDILGAWNPHLGGGDSRS